MRGAGSSAYLTGFDARESANSVISSRVDAGEDRILLA